MRHTYLFHFYLNKTIWKRPEVHSEHTHFLTFMNNGKVFSSLDYMTCSFQCFGQFQLLPGHWQAKRYWISWDLKNPIYQKIILITLGTIWSFKFRTKRTEEVIVYGTTNTKNWVWILTCFVGMNGHKIISAHGVPLTLGAELPPVCPSM